MLEEAVQILEEPIQFLKNGSDSKQNRLDFGRTDPILEELIQFWKNGADSKCKGLIIGRMDQILEEWVRFWKNGSDFGRMEQIFQLHNLGHPVV